MEPLLVLLALAALGWLLASPWWSCGCSSGCNCWKTWRCASRFGSAGWRDRRICRHPKPGTPPALSGGPRRRPPLSPRRPPFPRHLPRHPSSPRRPPRASPRRRSSSLPPGWRRGPRALPRRRWIAPAEGRGRRTSSASRHFGAWDRWTRKSGALLAGIWLVSGGLRKFALLLFGLTTAKAFLADVWQLDITIRSVAFVALGIALLSASWLYRRYRDRIREWIEADAPEGIGG